MTDVPKRRITAEDIYRFKMVSDPQVSPDGESVAYVVTTIDEETNGYLSSIYVGALDGSKTTRLTTAQARDSSPRWSPDGNHIAFQSNRSETAQLWITRVAGGEPWKITDFETGISGLSWSPDGGSIAVVSKDSAGDSDSDEDEDSQSDVKHITAIRYKSDDEGFLDMKPRNIWIVRPFDESREQLTSSDVHDTDPVWSPTGDHIAFVTNRTEERHSNSVSEIWTIAIGSGLEQPVFTGDDASFGAPAWSPDGSMIAAIGHREAVAGGSPDSHIWLASASGENEHIITGELGRSVGDSAMSDIYQGSDGRPIWSGDGGSLLFRTSDSGGTYIHRVPQSGGAIERLAEGRYRISGLSTSPDGSKLAYVKSTALNPGDIYVADTDGGNETRLTSVNEEFLSEIALSEPEAFWVDSPDGVPIQSWVIKPPGFNPDLKYPMILEIHGGPHGMYAEAFMHEFQLLAASGYVVLYTNPRGSSGYGEEFTRDSHKRWGDADMPDVMAAVDHVVAQGYVDESRMGVTGGSYGGYMTLWIIGHSDRFKAAVTQRCVSNLYSFYGTSDIGWTFIDYEFGGLPWENREHYMKYSPITYVDKMTTPLLIIHSEKDFRCPIEQGEQVFISLKRLGRDTEFVRFPDENHNLSRTGKPKHRIERLEHILRWFDTRM
ncbi:MAG: S9 family peptidase [Thermomicrobiales bacterium]